MDLYLEGKVFIVSGGSKGIGEGITRALAEEGAIPVIATRSPESTERLVKELRAGGKEVSFFLGGLEDIEFCKKIVEETGARYGQIDGIVNNAGVNDGVGLESGDPASFMSSLQKNLLHYYCLVHFALPFLKESKGAILNISSKVAITGQGGTSAYAAAKGAQLSLTREWAAELYPFGIRANAIIPAEVMTPQYKRWLDIAFDNPAEKEAEICRKIPLENRMTTSEEIAALAVFLLSSRSGHTTGQWMVPDGGYVHLDRALT
ncbi:MAG: SDR family oxidoreductase [Phaeodactylibacter sp.]|nr:SDR family oxidoreductase [Phaeodactylibacter sp.]